MTIYDTSILRGNETDLVIIVAIFYYIPTFNASCGRLGPHLDTAEMEDVITSVTAPHGVLSANRVTAHHTLISTGCQLFYQKSCQNTLQGQPYNFN